MLITLAALAAAQQPGAGPPAAQSPTVVVTGRRITAEEAKRRADAFVRAVGVAQGMRSAARWEDPVCPAVLGLSERQTIQVEARVRAVAADAGVKLGPPNKCRPNLLVTFTADAAATVREVARKSTRHLSHTPLAVRTALLSGDAPVRWWYRWGQRGRAGTRFAGDLPPILAADKDSNAPTAVLTGDEDGGANMNYGSSMISTQAQRVLRAATVVVDADGVRGLPLDAVAGLAAMLGLAEIRQDVEPPPGSILSLTGAGRTIEGPTETDMAFLRSLYRLPLDRNGRTHRGLLVRDVAAAELRGPEPR